MEGRGGSEGVEEEAVRVWKRRQWGGGKRMQ